MLPKACVFIHFGICFKWYDTGVHLGVKIWYWTLTTYKAILSSSGVKGNKNIYIILVKMGCFLQPDKGSNTKNKIFVFHKDWVIILEKSKLPSVIQKFKRPLSKIKEWTRNYGQLSCFTRNNLLPYLIIFVYNCWIC